MLKFKVKLFLSYSIKDVDFAKQLRHKLQLYPLIDVFMAPDDIGYGVLWAEEIKFRLKTCDAVIALITENFHTSDWTEQEMGLAWAYEKRIIGLTPDNTIAKGFVNRFQINPIDIRLYDNHIDDLVMKIYPEMESKEDFIEHLIQNLLPHSAGYYESNNIGRILKLIVDTLDSKYVSTILDAFENNSQVRGSHFWRSVIQSSTISETPFLSIPSDSPYDLNDLLK